jgi:hypothetical protein
MNQTVREFRDFFVSLKVTVVLLVLSLLLVFFATLDQVNLGIWAVQEKYFRSFFVLARMGDVPVPVFPGGYLIGGLLLINLVAAQAYRFRFTWRKSGIWLTHAGLILLLVGELLTGLWQREYQLRLTEGETKSYSESSRANELAIIETTDPKFDDVVAIPQSLLSPGREIQHPRLPFRVVCRDFQPNAALQIRPPGAEGAGAATGGVGPRLALAPQPVSYKQDAQNWPAAVIELIGPDGSLGTWLVSMQLPVSQTVTLGGRSWRIGLRPERAYKPFSLTLEQVRHDVYIGTDIPKNFSSKIRLRTPDGSVDREVLIYMNNPLRYAGLTFYQYQMDSEHATSVLQVVRNPSWLLPYISCAMMSLGLVVQFGIHLTGFVRRRRPLSA